MKDLSKMTASELQQMLTNIFAASSAYELEDSAKLERICIMFENDSSEKLALLENNPDEYYHQKYAQGPMYSEDEIISLVKGSSDLSFLRDLMDIVHNDRPKYAPQTFEVITKSIYSAMHLLNNKIVDPVTHTSVF